MFHVKHPHWVSPRASPADPPLPRPQSAQRSICSLAPGLGRQRRWSAAVLQHWRMPGRVVRRGRRSPKPTEAQSPLGQQFPGGHLVAPRKPGDPRSRASPLLNLPDSRPNAGLLRDDSRAHPGPFGRLFLVYQSTARQALAREALGRLPPRCLSAEELLDAARRGEASSDPESGSTARRSHPHQVAVAFPQERRTPGPVVGPPSAAPVRSKGSHQRSIGRHPPSCRHRARRHWRTYS